MEIFIRGFAESEFFVIPALTFVGVTIIRKKLNRKRPFELYDIPKLISHGNGQGFPSRHSACAVTISFAILIVSFEMATMSSVAAVVVCVTRILCGVHFVKDVFAGVVSGAVLWALWFVIQAVL